MQPDTATTSSFTTSTDESSSQHRTASITHLTRWVSRRISRAKTPEFQRGPTDSELEEEQQLNDSYAAYCRDFSSRGQTVAGSQAQTQMQTGGGVEGDQGNRMSRVSFEFLPVGAHGFTPLVPRAPTPPPRSLTPSLHADTTRAEEEEEAKKEEETKVQKKPGWWTRLLCGCH